MREKDKKKEEKEKKEKEKKMKRLKKKKKEKKKKEKGKEKKKEKFKEKKKKKKKIDEENERRRKEVAEEAEKEEEEQRIKFPLLNGTEIIIKTKIIENSSFNGEVLIVRDCDDKFNYSLGMANSCDGLWGNEIIKSQSFLLRYGKILKSPKVPLIEIEFSLLNAVYDIRTATKSSKLPVRSTLEGWRWLDSWDKVTWTTQPTHFSYQHILNLAKIAIEDNFVPIQGRPRSQFILFILLIYFFD